MDNKHHVGRVVREFRRSLGLSQMQLAKLLDMDQSALSRLELGMWEPKVSFLTRAADLMEEREQSRLRKKLVRFVFPKPGKGSGKSR